MSDLEGNVNKCHSKDPLNPDIHNGTRSAHSQSHNCSSKETGSGFMLLSVKHLSKVKRTKQRATSIDSNVSERNGTEICETLPFSNFSQVDGVLMPQNTMCDEAIHDVYGSGSIEAEEFEDFDDPEDDIEINDDGNIMRDSRTLSQNCFDVRSCSVIPTPVKPSNGGDICQFHPSTNSQSFVKPLNGRFRPYDSADKVYGKKFTSMYQDGYQQNHCLSPITIPNFGHPRNSECLQPFQSESIYPAYSRDPCDLVSINPIMSNIVSSSESPPHVDYYPSSKQNLNIAYHLRDQGTIPDPHGFRINSDVSYSKSICNMVNNNYSDPPNTSNWVNLTNVLHPTYHIGLSPHSRHGSYNQPITCLHHLHPSTSSGNTASTVSVNNHLTSDVVAMAAASLPPLQPASRFRKARIHETVEQWSYGRFSVHDCHLKAIPDWVSELQKRSFVREKAVTTLANKRIKCLSCFISKGTEDKESSVFPRATHDSAHVGASVDTHSRHSHKEVDALENELEAHSMVLSNGFAGTNLFSFWNNGLRVHSQVPFAATHIRSSEPVYDSCGNRDNTSQDVIELECKDQSACAVNGHYEHSDSVDSLSQRENRIQGDKIEFPDSSSIPLYASDPATAYLRRQNMGISNYVNKLSIVTELEQHYDDSATAPLKTSNMATLTKSDSTYTDSKEVSNRTSECGNSHIHEICCCKTSEAISNNAPPVSPNSSFVPNRPHQIPLELQISAEISKSRLRLLDLLPDDDNNLGRECTNILSIDPNVQRLINTEGAKLINKCESEYSFSKSNNSGGFSMKSLKNSGSYSQSCRRSKSFDDSSCISRLNRIKNNRLYNSDIVKRTCAPLTVNNVTSSGSPKGIKFPSDFAEEVEYYQNSRESSLLSDRLEARIRASMEAIRSTLVNSFRDELATVLAENVNLRSEITRLNSELTLIRSYQHAFFAIRPFVPPGLWENICVQQGLPVSSFDSEYQSPFNPQVSR
ncbi:unnamed protein product [Schistosoma margrebowiei]|uniref:BMERB domain-containing protein n=1 Tax=Schistosoma margrebowiei TaxID=48269 RepID=A0AA84ZKE2_9TREM|nr:unnamed protein product [Schistosoma margrebowiei]